MNIDLTPLYRNTIGFDRLASVIDGAMRTDHRSVNYPPYDIEQLSDNEYSISLAIAGFTEDELDIQSERGVLTISGKKNEDQSKRKFLHQGIANRSFIRKFNLADYVEVQSAKLDHGMLYVKLKRELPEAMKPRRISINGSEKVLTRQEAA